MELLNIRPAKNTRIVKAPIKHSVNHCNKLGHCNAPVQNNGRS